MNQKAKPAQSRTLAVVCLLIAGVYLALANLKGIDNDEGFRLGITNGGQVFSADVPGSNATWSDVLRTNKPYAYQPLYFLVLNTVMRAGRTHDEFALKCVNVFFLWVALQGLLALSRSWPLWPRLFLLGLFGANAFLLMHVLQLREYIVCIAFYVWSSWFALKLDRRTLERGLPDAGWFAGYGVLLALGFYTSTWAVMPAVAQGVFLVLRGPAQRWRFYANLALSYAIVLVATLPYLQHHHEKVNIGRWGSPETPFWPWMGQGFYYVLTGQDPGRHLWANLLLACWLILLVLGGLLFLGKAWRTAAPDSHREAGRTGWLMLVSLGVAVGFQVVYFLKVDTLSVWPRYFALHYFFTFWLVALAFLAVYELATAPAVPPDSSLPWRKATRVLTGVLLVSAALQVWSYWRDPYLDTGLSPKSNWRVVSASLARETQPGDAILMQDFLQAWTLTFTRPISHPILFPDKLDARSLEAVRRVVYLEFEWNVPARAGIVDRLASLGFKLMRQEDLRAADGTGTVPLWRIMVFTPR